MSDQPTPNPNQYPPVYGLVIADILRRADIGKQRYGTHLQPHNGRDSLRDAYEEAIDLAKYLRACLYERDGK